MTRTAYLQAFEALCGSLQGISEDITCSMEVHGPRGSRMSSVEIRLKDGEVTLRLAGFPFDLANLDRKLERPLIQAWPGFLKAIEEKVEAVEAAKAELRPLEVSVQDWTSQGMALVARSQ